MKGFEVGAVDDLVNARNQGAQLRLESAQLCLVQRRRWRLNFHPPAQRGVLVHFFLR